MSSKPEESTKLQLELGDIIKILAPDNTDINNKTFFIQYLDDTKVELIDIDDDNRIVLNITDGKLNDESIEQVEILSRAEQKGYARQNGLVPGTWISVHLGGDVPTVINGQVSSLEEDMIEISLWPNKEKIYIDFGYKGIPENIPIESINPFTPPEKSPSPPPSEEGKEVSPEFPEALSLSPGTDVELDIEEEGLSPPPQAEPVIDIPQERRAQLFSADEVEFGEELEELDIFVDVPEEERRYSIEAQSNDLLNDLLSTIPAADRTKKVYNSLHIMIERYRQLRSAFSKISESGDVGMPDTKGADYKPLVGSLEALNVKLNWILPIVKNNKVLYNFELDAQDVEPGITETTLALAQEGIYDITQQYKGNLVPDGQNKYIYKYQELNPYLTPFREPSSMANIIINKETGTNLDVVLNNDLDLQSFALCGSLPAKGDDGGRIPIRSRDVSGIHLEKSKFNMARYETGLTQIKPKDIRQPSLNTALLPVTPNDTMAIMGTLTLPESVMRYSQINLPATSVYTRAILNQIPFTYSQFLNNKTKYVNNIVDEENLRDREPMAHENYLKKIESYVFAEAGALDDRGPREYTDYLDRIVPRTRNLFELVKKYIVNTTSYLSILEYLQPFLIFPDDISFKQYETIVRYMVDEILTLKKLLATKRQKLISYLDYKYDADISFKNSYLFALLGGKSDENKEILEKYDLSTATTAEFMRRLLVIDNGKLFMNALALEDIELFVAEDIEELIKTQIGAAEEEEGEIQACKNFVLAKFYIDIDDLRADDGTPEVYFDTKYDETRYDIIKEFSDEQAAMPPVEFNNFLVEHLKTNVGLKPDEAAKEADALINKKRRVSEGDYAFIINSNNENIYFVRDDNNTWIAVPDLDGEPVSKAMFCNLKKSCLSINNSCGDIVINKDKIKKQLINDMLEQFDETVKLGNQALSAKLSKSLQYNMNIITKLVAIRTQEQLKYDLMKKMLGMEVVDRVVQQSQYALLRDMILSQEDFVSKQTDILKFINKACRPPQPIAGEDENWFYCIDTDTKLLPTFYETLANAFFSQGYEEVLAQVAAARGEISDDGDKIVDKYSGYLIRRLEFDEAEGYDEAGYKIVSRAILNQDVGDMLMDMSFKPTETLRSKDGTMIRNVILTLNKQLDISIGSEIDFVIHNVEAALDAYIPDEKTYNLQRAKIKKRMGSYIDIHDEALLLLTLAYYLVTVQTMMPSVKTSKTFKGCGPRSFVGYPLEGVGDYNALKYISCVALRLRSRTRPWQRLPALTRKTGIETLKKFMQKLKGIIDKELLPRDNIQERIQAKLAYNEGEDPDVIIPKEFDVRHWLTFLPPLHPIKITGLSNIGPTFRESLSSEVREGSAAQFTRMATLYGKITLFSLRIQELIQMAVNKSTLLLENINNELLIENACCNDGNKNTVMYFEEKEPGILAANNTVFALEALYDMIKQLTDPAFLFDPKNTKLVYPQTPNTFSKETIYKAFIRFCYFNTGIILDSRLQMICGKNASAFKNTDEISKKISILESEQRVYTMEAFLALMDIVNKDNIINVNLSAGLLSPRAVLEGYIKTDDVLRSLDGTPLVGFLENLETLFDRYDVLRESDAEEAAVMRTFEGFINQGIDDLMQEISTFLRIRGGGADKDHFLADIDKWKLRGENIYMSKEDETAIAYVDWTKTTLANILQIFPTIIQNEISFENPNIPLHWKSGSQKLSDSHIKDIQRIIQEEYSTLKSFYGSEPINAVLVEVLDSPERPVIMHLLKIFPFFADVRLVSGEERVATILNGPMIKKIMKYLTLYSLHLYITKLTDVTVRDNQTVESTEAKATLEDQIIEGRNMEVNTLVGRLLTAYLDIMERDKEIINISNYEINQDVLKSKEKEKAKITKRLGDLSVDERRVEDLMKEHRLGKWGVGQTRALYIYDEDQYEKERHELEQDALEELRLDNTDGVTNRLRDIYRMEHLEEQLVNDRIQQELNAEIMAVPGDDDFGERDDDAVGYSAWTGGD